MVQLILTFVFYLWLLIVLVLLYLMWRDGTVRITRLQQALIDMSNKSIETAQTSADTAQTSADTAQRAVMLVEEKEHDA